MQQQQRRKERVEMHVKAIAPFDVAIGDALPQVPIGEQPRERGHQDADQNKVDNDDVENAVNRVAKRKVQRVSERRRRDAHAQNE